MGYQMNQRPGPTHSRHGRQAGGVRSCTQYAACSGQGVGVVREGKKAFTHAGRQEFRKEVGMNIISKSKSRSFKSLHCSLNQVY